MDWSDRRIESNNLFRVQSLNLFFRFAFIEAAVFNSGPSELVQLTERTSHLILICFTLNNPRCRCCCNTVFSEAPHRAFYTEPVWLLAIARSHRGPGLAAHGGGKKNSLICCHDKEEEKKIKLTSGLWVQMRLVCWLSVKEEYRPSRSKRLNAGDARMKHRLPSEKNNVFSS